MNVIISKYIQCKIDSKSFAGAALSGIFKHFSGPCCWEWHSRGRRFDPDQLQHYNQIVTHSGVTPFLASVTKSWQNLFRVLSSISCLSAVKNVALQGLAMARPIRFMQLQGLLNAGIGERDISGNKRQKSKFLRVYQVLKGYSAQNRPLRPTMVLLSNSM
jgi:hypothetical protein